MTDYTLKDVLVSYMGDGVDLDTFSISLPAANQGSRNTKVIISPKPGSGYYNSSKITYDRINLATFGQVKVSKGLNTKVVDILPRIVDAGGILTRFTDKNGVVRTVSMGVDDISNKVLPAIPSGGSVAFNVEAHYKSYIFYGTLSLLLTA